MSIFLIGFGCISAILVVYFFFQIHQIKATISQHADSSLSKKDPVWREISLVLKDALKDGEGIFLVRKLDDSEYYYRMDPDEIYRRSKKN